MEIQIPEDIQVSEESSMEHNNEVITEDKSVASMRFDIARMIEELNAHISKSRFKSLAITELERAQYYLWRDAGNQIN